MYIYKILTLILFLMTWQFLANSNDSIYIVTFTQSLNALGDLFINQNLIQDLLASIQRIFYSIIIVFSISIPFGILISQSKASKLISLPITNFLRYIPAPTLIPIAVMWLGIGEISKVFIVSWGIFFPTLLAIRDASNNIPVNFLHLGKSMGYTKTQEFRHIILPYISPDLINILRVIIVEAWIYLLIAEIIGAKNGIGKTLILAQRFLQVDNIYAILLLLSVIGISTDFIFIKLRKKLFKYKYL